MTKREKREGVTGRMRSLYSRLPRLSGSGCIGEKEWGDDAEAEDSEEPVLPSSEGEAAALAAATAASEGDDDGIPLVPEEEKRRSSQGEDDLLRGSMAIG